MKYVLKPSLEHMTTIKIAAVLCKQGDVKDLLKKFSFPLDYQEFKSKWEIIEGIVVKKLAVLPLPEQIKNKLLSFIRPVGFQIAKWSQFLYRTCNLKVNIPNKIFWKPQGTIDEKKTAQVMIKDESIDITTRYKLACIFCLEDDIPKLWEELPEGCRKSFYSEEDPKLVNQNDLVVFWTYHIKGEVDKMESMMEEGMNRRGSPYQYAFEITARGGNIVAAEYFLPKLTSTERVESLVKTAMDVPRGHYDRIYKTTGIPKETCSHIFYFVLSELNEEQQIEVFKAEPHLVLLCFLDWPLQSFFMETANRMWDYLVEDHYTILFSCIIVKLKVGYKDFDYQKLFGEFWQQIPDGLKRNIFSVDHFHLILSCFFSIRDEINIKLIFQEATLEEKRYLICNDMAQGICKELINSNQLCLLKYFIKECLSSKDEVIEFKEDFKNGHVWHADEYLMSNWQQKFLHVLDNIICEFKKRKCDEDDSSIAKRVCSAELNDVAHSAEK